VAFGACRLCLVGDVKEFSPSGPVFQHCVGVGKVLVFLKRLPFLLPCLLVRVTLHKAAVHFCSSSPLAVPSGLGFTGIRFLSGFPAGSLLTGWLGWDRVGTGWAIRMQGRRQKLKDQNSFLSMTTSSNKLGSDASGASFTTFFAQTKSDSSRLFGWCP